MDRIEFAKKETRMHDSKIVPLQEWLSFYNSTDAYMMAVNPDGLGDDLVLPPVLACADNFPYLTSFNVWMSSGDTKSVLHNDGLDNVHCQLDGVKRVALFDAINKSTIESGRCGWYVADDDADEQEVGYGAFAKIDVDAVDPQTTHGLFELPWWEATLTPGDCLFLPTGWYHHVWSQPGRNLAFNMWWVRNETSGPCEPPAAPIAASSCKWRYEDPIRMRVRRTPPDPHVPAEQLSACADAAATTHLSEHVPHAASLAADFAVLSLRTLQGELKSMGASAADDDPADRRRILALATQRLRHRYEWASAAVRENVTAVREKLRQKRVAKRVEEEEEEAAAAQSKAEL